MSELKTLRDIAPDKEKLKKDIHRDELFKVDTNDVYWFGGSGSGGGSFLIPNGREGYQALGTNDFKQHLKICGFDDIRPEKYCGEDSKISAVDYFRVWIQQKRNVDFIGSLAGYPVGLKEFGGKLALVTQEAKHPQPKECDFSFIDEHFRKLLGGDEQIQYFYGWLQKSLSDIRAGELTSGLVMALAGPVDCGKSLFKKMLSKIFGGRGYKAGSYLKGKTDFNANLCASELWFLDDEISPEKFSDRQQLAQFIKQVAADTDVEVLGKFKDGFTVPIFRRLLICSNDKIESLKILPPIGMDGVSDKLLVFKAHSFQLPPLATPEDRRTFWRNFDKALPGFIDYILNHWITPEEIRSVRWGVTAYHSPEIYEELLEAQPETKFHHFVQEWLKDNHKTSHQSSSKVLLESLDDGSISFRQMHLTEDSIGRYVQRLHDRGGEFAASYKKGKSNGGRYVRIGLCNEESDQGH